MARIQPNMELDGKQEGKAQRIYERLEVAFDQERMRMARLLASKGNHELFGQTEFELRDRVHELGARVLETAADERQKRGGYEGASLVCPHCAMRGLWNDAASGARVCWEPFISRAATIIAALAVGGMFPGMWRWD